MLNRKTAEQIVSEVAEVVKGWRGFAVRLGISKREMEMFSGILDERCGVDVL
jgi:serine/threonine-protein kinase HipA